MSTRRSRRPVAVDDTIGPTRRLTAQFAVLVLLVVGVVGVVVYGVVATSVSEARDRALHAAVEIDEPDEAPLGTFVTIVDGDRVSSSERMPPGLLDPAAIEAVAAGERDLRTTRTVDGRTYDQLTTTHRSRDRVIQVSIDQHEGAEELQRLTTALLTAGIVGVALSVGGAFLMARRAVRPLADALALQRRFVADASHELRTPLTILSARAQLLARRSAADSPAHVTAAAAEIVDDAKGLTAILEDLLIAADPRMAPDPSPVDLAAVAGEALADLAMTAAERGIALAQTGDRHPVAIRGSATAIKRLVVALATNAIDHARSTVTVAVERDRGRAVIRVSDDGAGFTPDMRAAAFERFASGRDGAQPPGDRHYGLGLAVVAEIVQRHGGTVRVVPTSAGATVECTFAAVSDPPRTPAA